MSVLEEVQGAQARSVQTNFVSQGKQACCREGCQPMWFGACFSACIIISLLCRHPCIPDGTWLATPRLAGSRIVKKHDQSSVNWTCLFCCLWLREINEPPFELWSCCLGLVRLPKVFGWETMFRWEKSSRREFCSVDWKCKCLAFWFETQFALQSLRKQTASRKIYEDANKNHWFKDKHLVPFSKHLHHLCCC